MLRPILRSGITRAAMLAAAGLAIAAGCAGKSATDQAGLEGSGEFREGGPGGMGSETPQRVPELDAVYFDFDKYDVRDDARPVLRANANAITSHSEWRTITVEGHCDERGSEEYNLALGERRANAARRYLVDLGIDASRLVTVSFGESTPAVQGHDESAWRWNRRVEFRVSR